ncbi:hypothetical protein J6524_06890 [Bradyrhizobium sp. WSM 1738]|uniref:hypothetical protein n=1 Tax=Bradyrhizobium hereditatis TaxID=2821405 RepID=UPI0028977E2A|nr:hypothetical protein [Bradyrhizobium hereditatis]MCA6114645.1 hypothetical protein [Bradyrhizobium hereditatis]
MLFLPNMAAESGLREVAWQLALELGKITGDHSDVETLQDRSLGLAIKQKFERCLDAALGRVRAHRQPFANISSHRDVMARLAVSRTDDDLEFEWIAFAGSLDLDHSLPPPKSVQFGCRGTSILTQGPTVQRKLQGFAASSAGAAVNG